MSAVGFSILSHPLIPNHSLFLAVPTFTTNVKVGQPRPFSRVYGLIKPSLLRWQLARFRTSRGRFMA